jgi:hypothetical protein
MNETVLFDPRSRTLVLTDITFNLVTVEGWFARASLRMLDAYGTFGPSWLCRNVYIGEKSAMRRSIDHLLTWDFDRVVLAHGEIVETGGREGLRSAFAWMKQESSGAVVGAALRAGPPEAGGVRQPASRAVARGPRRSPEATDGSPTPRRRAPRPRAS